MEAELRLVGGHLAIDFLNTVDADAPTGDHLRSDDDVVAWLHLVGLSGRPPLKQTRELRTSIDAVLRPLANGQQPTAADLDGLRRREADALRHATLDLGGLHWSDPLPQITHASVELLLHGPLDRLRQCNNCSWLFLDLSRNASRHWCSMEGCGTQVKIHRLTERRRITRSRKNRAI